MCARESLLAEGGCGIVSQSIIDVQVDIADAMINVFL